MHATRALLVSALAKIVQSFRWDNWLRLVANSWLSPKILMIFVWTFSFLAQTYHCSAVNTAWTALSNHINAFEKSFIDRCTCTLTWCIQTTVFLLFLLHCLYIGLTTKECLPLVFLSQNASGVVLYIQICIVITVSPAVPTSYATISHVFTTRFSHGIWNDSQALD
jgi:hypothetical protein